jgi:hypothetical protein
MDGFGTCLSGIESEQSWWQNLYLNDLQASILRVDLTPVFNAPYSDYLCNSPWFHNNPALPGPETNNVRTYTSASNYGRLFAGHRAPIAVMGPDIDRNIKYLNFGADGPRVAGVVAGAGARKWTRPGNQRAKGLSSDYIIALKAVRAELDKYPDLASIQLMGPEDLLGGDACAMWQLGGGRSTAHKNLQYLQK